MNEQSLTEGARRAVERAVDAATEWRHTNVRPAHLLWSLLEEESIACESLGRAGVTLQIVLAADIWSGAHPPVDDDSTDDDETLDALTRDVSAALNLSIVVADPIKTESFQQVQFHARWAARADDSEIGTEHLLAGLVAVESPVSTMLRRHGLVSETPATASADEPDLAEPMPVTFEIDFGVDTDSDRTAACRIIDAAANRAREGLRVVEDYVRFALDDAHLSRLLKLTRHQLSSITQILDSQGLLASRDTRSDVGTEIHTQSEMTRATPLDVAQASLKRAQEAARTLEEFSKVVTGTVPPGEVSVPERFGRLRYDLYSLEKAILTTAVSNQRLAACSLYLLLTAELCPGGLDNVLNEATGHGVRIVQLREKSLADRELLIQGRRMRELTSQTDTLLIMNDRPDLAVLCGADGVHVGQDELSVRDVRRIVGPERLIGVSTHSIKQARQAVLDGADYLGVGPVFSSKTKSFDKFAGLDFVRQVADEITLPWFAIGGISSENLADVQAAGARRIAVSAAICGAESPGSAAADMAAQLSNG